MNKRAFVLMETIVVIVVVSVALLTIFSSYNKILSKVKNENKYDTSEYIYMTNYVKQYLKKEPYKPVPFAMNEGDDTRKPTDYFSSKYEYYNNNYFGIKRIYLLSNLNSIIDSNLKKFDAYMIDYLRKLDVGDSDVILVVEYERTAIDNKGEPIYTTSCSDPEEGCKPLTETYIASLEWDNE